MLVVNEMVQVPLTTPRRVRMAFPKFEDYKAPWETKDGKDVPEEDQVIDKGKLKKFLHGLHSDKDRLQTSVVEVTKERDDLRTKVDEAAREGESETERLRRENEDLKAAAAKVPETTREALLYKVALEKGLTPAQAKRLQGNTEEELSADADELLETWRPAGNEGEGEGKTPLQRAPRPSHNPGDPEGGESEPFDVARAVDGFARPLI